MKYIIVHLHKIRYFRPLTKHLETGRRIKMFLVQKNRLSRRRDIGVLLPAKFSRRSMYI